MWNIEKTVKKGDYLYGVCKEHPKASKHGYVLLHRLIMENIIGRQLHDNEIVHHKNHDKKDNSPDNLEVMDFSDHVRLHASTGRKMTTLICFECGKEFNREMRNVGSLRKGYKNDFCSRSCSGKNTRRLQMSRI